MTTKEFRKSISDCAKRVMKKHGIRYMDIKLLYLYQLGYIEGCNEIYLQGDSFDTFMEEYIKPAVKKSGLSDKTCFLWFLESSGVL